MSFLKKNLALIWFSIWGISLIFLEPRHFGFKEQGHLGWVPSHAAAQIIKAKPTNFMVGYTLSFENGGFRDFQYFDRYPFLFSAITSFILSPFENNLEYWVFMSKQWMNLIYFLTLIGAYLILNYLTEDVIKKIFITTLAFSGFFYIEYKSMIHFDQPAILGMVFLMESIFYFEKTAKKSRLIFWSLIAPLMGRGYASLFLLCLYFLMKIGQMLKYKNEKPKELLKLALMTLIPGGIICASFLAYNIFIETKIRKISIEKTSIVISAKSRLGIDAFKEVHREKSVSWLRFLPGQVKRLKQHLTPYLLPKDLNNVYIILLAVFLLYSLKKSKTFPITKAETFFVCLLILSGPFWIFPMKRLASFHDYTAMYYWGLSLSVYYILTKYIKNNRLLMTISLSIMIGSLLKLHADNLAASDRINKIAHDFHQIRSLVISDLGNKRIFIPEGHRVLLADRPYILGFYFPEFAITSEQVGGDYLITKESFKGKLLYQGDILKLYKQDEVH